MKRFIAKIIVFFLIVGTLTVCVNFVYMKRDHSNPQNVNKFQNIPSSIKVCNFGSSHGLNSFNYTDVDGVECFNFALLAQVFSYDRRLFDYYNDKIAEGAVVFIPVSYFSLHGNPETMGDEFLYMNRRYYKILPKKMIKEYDIKTDIYVNYFPSLLAGDGLVKTILLGSEDTSGDTWSRLASDIDVAKDAEYACERHLITNKLDENGNRILNQEEIEALEYLIDACHDKGYIPILVTTPYLREYTDAINKEDPDFLDGFYELVHKIAEGKGAAYYDYGFDDRFIERYDWFVNSDHLNVEGARQFTNILMDEVVHYGTDESLIK